ncbi:unnamed protein product, partial [Cylicostephanus goldi]
MHISRTCSAVARQALMRAWQVQAPAEPLQLNMVPKPVITASDQVLVRVK